ncbi:hypothetical protein CR513_26890, partial [Mucuna pruriens]
MDPCRYVRYRPKFPLPSFVHIPKGSPSKPEEEKVSGGEEKAIKAETTKLLQAKFTREVKYPSWLSNMVMVKKHSNKWRMHAQRTLTLYLDTLVDRASICNLLSFMDTYSSYNRIRMHLSDESKTAFITDKDNFCYRVMPFSLKNAGATY